MITNWNALPIGKYLELCDILRSEPKDEVEALDQQCEVVALLSNIERADIDEMPLEDYQKLVKGIAFLNEEMPKTQTMQNGTIKIGEWVLKPATDIGQMTTAQYIDFQTFVKDAERNTIDILAVCLVPEGCKYNKDYDLTKLKEDIAGQMSVPQAMEITAFFLNDFQGLIGSFLSSLDKTIQGLENPAERKKAMEAVEKLRTTLEQSGVGFHR